MSREVIRALGGFPLALEWACGDERASGLDTLRVLGEPEIGLGGGFLTIRSVKLYAATTSQTTCDSIDSCGSGGPCPASVLTSPM